MKNAKKKLILLVIAIILLLSAVFMTIFINKRSSKIASIEENEKKATDYITGVSDSRFTYEVNIFEDERTITLVKYIGTDTDVVIPSTIDGYTVTKIRDAFICESGIINLTIPSTLIKIDTLNRNNTATLKNIYVQEGNESYISKDGVLFSKDSSELIIYPAGKEGTTYQIPNGVNVIEKAAFAYSQNLISVIIPNTVNTIKGAAFIDSLNLESINIPDSVVNFGDSIFMRCRKLKDVVLSSKMTEITFGMFEECTLLQSINLPDTINIIRQDAFLGCHNLEELILPEGVKEIEGRAFGNCKKLVVTIPDSVTAIGEGAFGHILIDGSYWWGNIKMIKCNRYSYAYEYALENEMEFTSLYLLDLKKISIKTNPTKMTYKQNTENLDLTGGELTLTYNDNSTETKSMKASGVTATGFSNSTLGTVPVTISYGGKSTTLNVTIIENQQPQKTLSEISVKTLPTKTSYKKDNEDLDLTGGIITLKYTDNTTEEKAMTSNDVTVTGFSNTTLGKKELTVKYGNKTTKFEVEIIGNFNYEQTPDGDGVIITGGEDGNPNIVIPPEIDGKPVTGIGDGAFKDRDDLESVEIPDSVIDIADDAFEGSEDTIIICNPGSKAEEFAKDHDMSYIYKDKTIAGLSVKTLPSKITYTQGVDTKLDLTGGRLTVSYSEAGLTSVLRMTSKGITVSNVDMTTVGTKPVTVSYAGKSAAPFEITVGGTQSDLLGDIDGNGVVESTDLLLMKRHIIAGSKTEWILTGDKFTRGDMNSDNVINPTDLLLLKRKIVSRVDR